jgi:hypothetical protein
LLTSGGGGTEAVGIWNKEGEGVSSFFTITAGWGGEMTFFTGISNMAASFADSESNNEDAVALGFTPPSVSWFYKRNPYFDL